MSGPAEDATPATSEPALPPQRPSGRARQFDCPKCGGVVRVTAVGHTVSVVCQHCSSVLDAANENVRILIEAHEATRPTLIELGSRGTLRGIEWEAIGFMTRKDEKSRLYWAEYLLFNPFHGFRFLVQADGQWTLARVLKEDLAVTDGSDDLKFRGRNHRQSSTGKAVVTYVKGEFYWRVAVGETWRTADYDCAPNSLTIERNDEEINVSLADYLDPDEIRRAFGVAVEMPQPFGFDAQQPNKIALKLNRIWKMAAAAFVAAIAIQMVTSSLATDKAVLYLDLLIPVADKDKTYTSNEFVIPKTGNLKIESTSPVSNNWAELDLSLVNTKTDEEITATQAIEYYTGQDSDGPWSEGSTQTVNVLSHIPAGTYRLLVDLDSGVFAANQDLKLRMMIINDVSDLTNLLIVLVMLAIYPLVELYRYFRLEKLRWTDSE